MGYVVIQIYRPEALFKLEQRVRDQLVRNGLAITKPPRKQDLEATK